MSEEVDAVRERFARFARDEAPGRSELYGEWAEGVSADAATARILARIPANRRQPALVFAVTRLLGAPEEGFAVWRAWLARNADAVVAESGRRSVQTNEPLRCAALLPALAAVPGPIALLEVGASAGLCLYPDRYSYRYVGVDGTLRAALDPLDGPSTVVLDCVVRGEGMPRVALPDVVWRAGIDVAPLDPSSVDTAVWLTQLVWPGEAGRVERVREALCVAASDPPMLVAGDGAAMIAEVAAAAPADATLVVTTPGVLAHIPWAGRKAVIAAARAAGRWITIDAPGLHDGWRTPVDVDDWPGGFAVALDGEVLAAADPLGAWLEWRAGDRAAAG